MALLSIVKFIATAFFVEGIIEFLRYAFSAIWYNLWPEKVLLSDKNPYFDWFLNIQETVFIMVLLYLGYSFLLVILCPLLVTFIIQKSYRFFVKK